MLSKSSALALALIHLDGSSPEAGYLDIHDAVNIARIDEHYQQSIMIYQMLFIVLIFMGLNQKQN